MPGDNWAVTAASTRRAKKERALLSNCRRCRRVLRRNFSRRECPSRRLGESASTLRAFPNSGPRGRSWPRRRSCERQRHAHHPDPTARAHRPAATALYELFRWPARRLRFAPVRLLVRTSPRQICHPARCSSRNERLADSLAAAPGRRQKIRGSHVVALALHVQEKQTPASPRMVSTPSLFCRASPRSCAFSRLRVCRQQFWTGGQGLSKGFGRSKASGPFVLDVRRRLEYLARPS